MLSHSLSLSENVTIEVKCNDHIRKCNGMWSGISTYSYDIPSRRDLTSIHAYSLRPRHIHHVGIAIRKG